MILSEIEIVAYLCGPCCSMSRKVETVPMIQSSEVRSYLTCEQQHCTIMISSANWPFFFGSALCNSCCCRLDQSFFNNAVKRLFLCSIFTYENKSEYLLIHAVGRGLQITLKLPTSSSYVIESDEMKNVIKAVQNSGKVRRKFSLHFS